MEHHERTGCYNVSLPFLDKTVRRQKMKKREERVRIPRIVKVALFFVAVASILFKKEWMD